MLLIPQNWKLVARPLMELVRSPPCLLAADLAAPQGLQIAPWQEVALKKLALTRADYPHPPSLLEVFAPVLILWSPPWARVFGECELPSSASSAALPQPCPGSPSQVRESPLPPVHSPSKCPTPLLVVGSFGYSRMDPSALGQAKAWLWTPPTLQS